MIISSVCGCSGASGLLELYGGEHAVDVEQLVRASNGEGPNSADQPGQTAVLQAHNQLLGTLSHETHNVIALRAARLRAEHERHAQTQTSNAFHRARRESVMSDWPTGTAR